jgi:hypothetical protein
MNSNEHPDMSGNPCDDPIICDQCGDPCREDDLYGSMFGDSEWLFLNFCCQECVDDWEDEK